MYADLLTPYREKLSFLKSRGWKKLISYRFLVTYEGAPYPKSVPLDHAYYLEKTADRICNSHGE